MSTNYTALDVLEVWTVVGGSIGLTFALVWIVHEIWKYGCFGCCPRRSASANPRKMSIISTEEGVPTYSAAPFPNGTPRVSSVY